MLRRKFCTFGLPPDGIFILAGGLRSTASYKYTLLTDQVAAATSFTVTTVNSWAMGNTEKSIWGSSNQNGGSNTQKYVYASNTTGAGSNLTIGLSAASGASASAPTFGLTVTANSTNVGKLNKYTFAADSAITAAGSLITSGSGGSGAVGIGNKTRAIFANINTTVNTNKYNYSDDVVTQATNLFYATSSAYTTMTNKDFGLMIGNPATQQLNKYTFASDTCIAGTPTIGPALHAGGAGNSEVGVVFTQTANQQSNKYIYANDNVVVAGALTIICDAAIANGCLGVNI